MKTTCDYQFEFLCPMDWEQLQSFPDGRGKYCDTCQRVVHVVETQEEFAAAARRGDCVAVYPDEERRWAVFGAAKLPEFKKISLPPVPDEDL